METSAATLAPSAAADREEAPIRAVDCRWLFALYAVIPLSVAIVAFDLLIFDRHLLLNYLPYAPEQWPYWTLVFGLPHIVASLLTMADREYIGHYRRILLWPLVGFALIAAAGLYGPQPIGKQTLFTVVAFYTVYHVLSQQLGLTLMMLGTPPSRTFLAWKWTAILAGAAMYTLVFGHYYGMRRVWLGPVNLYDVLHYAAGFLTAGVIVLAFRLGKLGRHRIGSWYMWGNVALLVASFALLELRYTVFVVIMPRIIHDITAFTVYITHDANRNRRDPRNLLYRLTHFTRLPPWIVLPATALAVAYLLTTNTQVVWVNMAVVTISFLHYYFEGFIWRNPNPHRLQVAFRR